MYTFMFLYENNTFQEFEHIIRVEYVNAIDEVTVSTDEILKHNFPVNYGIHLFSENANHTASSKNLRTISVTKED